MKRMGKDVVKFDSLHPTEHKLLIMLINHARVQKGCTLVGKEELKEQRKSRILKLCQLGAVSRYPEYIDEGAFCLGNCWEQQER